MALSEPLRSQISELVAQNRVVLFMKGTRRMPPDGHFKFPHLWPLKLPQAGRVGLWVFEPLWPVSTILAGGGGDDCC